MASSTSTDLKLELITTGEKSGTWGTITNTNLQIFTLLVKLYFCFLYVCYSVSFHYLTNIGKLF